ncbi:MAG: GAF domain-containing protein, partial [Gemmatimonadetes bacterium]|nr:GAF domain-containing protein [Gemmatimonadota bacterium]
MSSPDRLVPATLPDPVLRALTDCEEAFELRVRLMVPPPEPGMAAEILYATDASRGLPGQGVLTRRRVAPRGGRALAVEILHSPKVEPSAVGTLLARTLERAYETQREIDFFTEDLSDRFEEIHLLYSISETLGTILHMDDAARVILREVCDVMGALRGSLWIYHEEEQHLHLSAAVGEDGLDGPPNPDDPDAVTSMVFREQKAYIVSRSARREQRERGLPGDSVRAVPSRYTPPSGEPRTLGVMNLGGRRNGERYSAPDQKLLSAIASQVGSALENKRLHDE